MRELARLRSLLRRWRRSSAHERALDAELQAYLQADIEVRIRAGGSPAEARREALIDLGGVEQAKETVRDARAGAWIDGIHQDLRYAIRTLRKDPSFTGSVIGSVGLGMAAMIAGFAFANAILFRETPGVRHPERLVEINVERPERGWGWSPERLSTTDYRLLAEGLQDLGPVAASGSIDVGVTLPAPRSLRATAVSDNYFDVLDARLAIGTPIRPSRDGGDAPDVAVLAHHLWMREFGGDPTVVGRVIRVGDVPVQIAGVAAADFTGPWNGPGTVRPDLWLPLRLADRLTVRAEAVSPSTPSAASPTARRLDLLVGRLRDGVALSSAVALAGPITAQLAAAGGHPPESRATIRRLGDQMRRWWGPLAMMVQLVPLLVLAIACVNAANLLLARVIVREREIAVRLAIGASRGRIVRQLLIESLLLALASTAVALPLTIGGLGVAEGALSMALPLDLRVISVTLATVVLCAIGFGLAPALRATSRPPSRGLSHSHAGDATPRHSRFRRALVVAQVALSLALLSMGSQLIASFRSTESSAGTPSRQLLVASFDLRQLNMPPEDAARFYATLLTRMSGRLDLEAAGLAPSSLPFSFSGGGVFVRYPPYGPKDGYGYGSYAGGELFSALGLRVLAGRAFTKDDQQDVVPRVVVVNQAFADRVLKGPALGRGLEVSRDATGAPISVQVVGVVESAYEPAGNHGATSRPTVYVPVALTPDPRLTLFAKSRTSASALMPIVRDVVHDIDPRVAFVHFGPLNDVMRSRDGKMAFIIALSWLGVLLGAMAVALAGWGLYAVMSHVVAMRSREFAVRLALGAETRAILSLVSRQAGVLAVVGGAIGTLAGILIGLSIQANWSGTVATGAGALLMSAAFLATVMFVAALVPAARASRVNPIVLLKD